MPEAPKEDIEKLSESAGKLNSAKPGYKTTEFWLSTVATMAGIAMASGFVADGSKAATIVGGVIAVLAAMGYTGSRTKTKKSSIEK